MTDRYRTVRDIQAAPSAPAAFRQAGPRAVRVLLALMSTLVLVFSGMGYFLVGALSQTVSGTGNLGLGDGEGSRPGQAKDGATDILLVGSDSRSDAQGNALTPDEIAMLRAGDEPNDNTDTIMLIRVPNDGTSATAISIPRDTYIRDDEFGNMKINGVYGNHKAKRLGELIEDGVSNEATRENQAKDAGRRALSEAVSDLTGVTVDHYAEVGLLGFVLLTDAVGGVDVCLNDATYDEFSGADFPAGRQTLNGPDALSFVRQRHGLPRGDLDRIVRQQVFMASLVNKVLSSGTLSSPGKLNELSTAVGRSVTIDENWDITQFGLQLQNLAGGNVHFETIPVTSIDGVGDYGESVVTVDTKQVHTFFEQLLKPKDQRAEMGNTPPSSSETPAPEDPAKPQHSANIYVLNAGGVSGEGARVGNHLTELGYNIVEVTNAPEGLYTDSRVLSANANDPAARELAKLLGDVPIGVSPSLEPGELAVVVHTDYRGPSSQETTQETSSQQTSVGQPGSPVDEESASPKFNAGGDGPRCVN
ncbi:LCP family protein [Corynebacterium freiburgense]|uniref:LCP family protein n=1 Tax=Corynebacterium freiburgense TaxID=556548 RepID=UPI0004010500|nr:LCP family protein [Corynebacterium freiburgense]WJZ01900.1 Transcriptional regulator LytR [Corynebacterium freiburgense]